MKDHFRLKRGPFLTTALAMIAGMAHAQDTTTEEEDLVADAIIVTATKRATSVQDVPFSINAQSADDIARTGATDIEDVARNVAGLTIQNLGPGQSQVAIRGVSSGQVVRDQPAVKEQVGVYLDESVVSLSLFTPDLDLFDLNRVETLRGPQGTLFGSGSVGGTVRYITNQPDTETFEGTVEANLNTLTDGGTGGHLKGMVNLPLAEDVLAARLVGYHTEFAGFIDGVTRNGTIEDVNDGTRTGGRLAVLFTPTPRVSLTPRIVYQEIDTNGYNREEPFNIYANPDTLGPGLLGEREQFLLRRESFSDETLITDLTASLDFGFAELVSVSSLTDRDIQIVRDGSALLHSVSLDLGYPLAITDVPTDFTDITAYESFTQELRLTSLGEGPWQWLIGGFYADNEREFAQSVIVDGYDAATDSVFGPGTADAVRNGVAQTDSAISNDFLVTLEQTALFGEVSYDFTDRLTVTVGGRFYEFEESRTLSDGGILANGATDLVDTTSSEGFNPRFLLSYDLNDSVTLNAQAAQGFRLGGVNNPLNLNVCTAEDRAIFGGFQEYDDETLWNYEAGFKAQQGAFTFNAAAFYNDISDLQVTLDAGSCSSRIVFNVPDAHAAGLEYELGFSPLGGLDIFFSGSIIEAEFDSTVRDGTGSILAGLEEGNRLATVPEFEMAASAVYRWDRPVLNGEAFAGGSIQHVGTRFTQPGDQTETKGLPAATGLAFGGFTGMENPRELVDTELDEYSLINLFAGLEYEELTIRLYVNNLLDENAQYSFDRERGGRARLGIHVGQPRTVGVTVRKRF